MATKIYTKTGDLGETSLIGGTRVPKYHLRIESYGTVDELNAYIGLLIDQLIDKQTKKILLEIQDRLFTIGSLLASDPDKSKIKVPDLKEEDIVLLETEMDKMDKIPPLLKSFILPGGHSVASHCHIARCICRRAERLVVQLSHQNEVPPIISVYLNRLSDYLFMLSRKIVFDAGADEIVWRPRI